MKKIIYVLAAPLILVSSLIMIANTFGGVISFIWLAILGQWKAIGIGVLSLFISHYILALALALGFIIMIPGVLLLSSKRKYLHILGWIFIIPSGIWNYGVMVGWSYEVLRYFYFYGDGSAQTPLLIWSYGIASAPWAYMASKEGKDESGISAAIIQSIIISISYLVTIFSLILFKCDFESSVTILFVAMALGLPIQIGIQFLKASKQSSA